MYSNGTDTSSQLTALGIVVTRDTASAGKTVWRGFGGGVQTSTIYSDGSATFKGSINSTATNQAFEVTASLITGGSFFRARNNVAASDKYFLYGDVDGVGPTVQLTTDGNITAADRITMGSPTNRGQFKGICPAAFTPSAAGFIDAQYDGTSVIEMKYDGSAQFTGVVNGVDFIAIQPSASNYCFEARLGGTTNAFIKAGGSAEFKGPISPGDADSGIALVNVAGETGACLLSTNKTDITSSRTANIGSAGQPWNKAYFAGTVTANGSVLTRAAGDLDVGDRLEKADNALQILKTAAAAASDFAALKAAIATALANI
jgi:hypothetical protein